MALRGLKLCPPACHAVAKSFANTDNYRFHDSVLT